MVSGIMGSPMSVIGMLVLISPIGPEPIAR